MIMSVTCPHCRRAVPLSVTQLKAQLAAHERRRAVQRERRANPAAWAAEKRDRRRQRAARLQAEQAQRVRAAERDPLWRVLGMVANAGPAKRRLGVPWNASLEAIEIAFRDKAKIVHPDAGGTHEEFLLLQSDRQVALAETEQWARR